MNSGTVIRTVTKILEVNNIDYRIVKGRSNAYVSFFMDKRNKEHVLTFFVIPDSAEVLILKAPLMFSKIPSDTRQDVLELSNTINANSAFLTLSIDGENNVNLCGVQLVITIKSVENAANLLLEELQNVIDEHYLSLKRTIYGEL